MFKSNKYTKWYYSIINNAKAQNRTKDGLTYYESHHIIPKCMGGTEEVLLTAKEHYICHLMLCRMLDGKDKHKMINAVIKMSFAKSNGQHRHTSRSYSLVRKLIAEKNSEMFKGIPKSEQTRNRMKNNNGKWKRTEEHNRNNSLRLKTYFETHPGTFTGKKFTEEMAIKRAKTRKERGIVPTFNGKGFCHYTNGVVSKRFIPGTETEGFYPGRIMKNQRERI